MKTIFMLCVVFFTIDVCAGENGTLDFDRKYSQELAAYSRKICQEGKVIEKTRYWLYYHGVSTTLCSISYYDNEKRILFYNNGEELYLRINKVIFKNK
jgi:hypothetical protein